jgi:hypothetical protein
MSSWGNYDSAANAPYWAVSTVSTGVNEAAAAPTAANVALLYGNTTSDVYVTNATVGLFMADRFEVKANTGIAGQGWQLRKEGSGGRAGRVQWETLVALSNAGLDESATTDDAILVDAIVTFTDSPAETSIYTGEGNVATFTVSTTVVPTTATLTYEWQYSTDGDTYAAAANGETSNTVYVGEDGATLSVYATDVDANQYYYRVQVTATNGANSNNTFTSANAILTLLAPE